MCTRKLRIFLSFTLLVLCSHFVSAQRMRHAPSRSSFNRSGNSGTINGGSYRSRTQATQQPSTSQHRPNRQANVNSRDKTGRTGATAGTSDVNRSSQRDINTSRDIDRNTVVRNNNVNVYHRPPYHYGGHHYYHHHPYYYHPYHAHYWGPYYNPWGVFVAAMAVTAIVIAIENEKYYYDQGVWYEDKDKGGYNTVSGPVGGSVTYVPEGAETVEVNNVTNYYYGGTYYEKDGQKYVVVPPPAGAVVENLPAGGEEVKIGDQTYVKIGETYYLPVQVDGKPKYEVAQVEKAEK